MFRTVAFLRRVGSKQHGGKERHRHVVLWSECTGADEHGLVGWFCPRARTLGRRRLPALGSPFTNHSTTDSNRMQWHLQVCNCKAKRRRWCTPALCRPCMPQRPPAVGLVGVHAAICQHLTETAGGSSSSRWLPTIELGKLLAAPIRILSPHSAPFVDHQIPLAAATHACISISSQNRRGDEFLLCIRACVSKVALN